MNPQDHIARMEAILSKIERAPTGRRATAARPKHGMPYYNEAAAQEAKKYLDVLIANPTAKVQIPSYELSTLTTRNKFYQGCLYLVENLDPNKIYHQYKERLTTRRKEDYIIVMIKHDGDEAAPALTLETISQYEKDLEEFIQNSTIGDRFPVEGVVQLADSDIDRLNNLFNGLQDNFLVKITRNNILVVRK